MLAVLITLLALRLGPFILGYMGAYDAELRLTFLPFDLSFSYGPLISFYVKVLVSGRLPQRWLWHLVPAAQQLVYQLFCFSLPLDAKWDWYTGTHLHLIAPAGAGAALLSTAVYLTVSWRAAGNYQRCLDNSFANKEEARLIWLRVLLLTFGSALAVAAGFALVSWLVKPLDYFDRFPLMLVSRD